MQRLPWQGYSLGAKAQMYIEAGGRLVWLVDPDTERTTLHESDTVEGGEVLPRFRMSLVDVFR